MTVSWIEKIVSRRRTATMLVPFFLFRIIFFSTYANIVFQSSALQINPFLSQYTYLSKGLRPWLPWFTVYLPLRTFALRDVVMCHVGIIFLVVTSRKITSLHVHVHVSPSWEKNVGILIKRSSKSSKTGNKNMNAQFPTRITRYVCNLEENFLVILLARTNFYLRTCFMQSCTHSHRDLHILYSTENARPKHPATNTYSYYHLYLVISLSSLKVCIDSYSVHTSHT